ncbi:MULTISPECIES: beta-glucoside kinase BglK [Enterobacter]|uniref:beta-glucoside kinase BglK n=1 Tax=Enterobacter TaxID=547 RepID=UPI0028E833C0|nr:beta-glucoside kinase BglK [Enterobacter cloacae]WNT38811.1 ROK family protein [Enterobacter cloacae]HDR2791918.1 ROK family protein [Enterobacter asburiae]HDR2797325.1 ROK family protein [Enterobacter asburiae]
MNIAAFDIGGTALKMGIVTTQGELLHRDKAAIKNSDGDAILSEMLQWVALHPDLEGIAISAPGYVNPHTGYIEMGGAIRRFDNFAMQEWLSAQTGLPVTVENDANCVLLAERWQGKAAGTDNFLVLTIGTGIGGAIFCNGKLVHGARFRAGEFGYMLTECADSRKVARHSMNENCTLRTLRKRYADYHGQGLDDVTGETIFDGYDAGDVVCRRLVDDFLNGIATGLYNLANVFDPQTIFIGGGIAERPGFMDLLRTHLTWFGIADIADVVSHGNSAGLIGAVYHFRQQYPSAISNIE